MSAPSEREAVVEAIANNLSEHEWIDGPEASCACGVSTLTYFAWRYHASDVLAVDALRDVAEGERAAMWEASATETLVGR